MSTPLEIQTSRFQSQTVLGLFFAVLAISLGCQRAEVAPPIVVTPVVHETIPTPLPSPGTDHLVTDQWATGQAATSRLVGVASCTASGCHGGGKAGEIIGSEYNIWISDDPHSSAFSVLYDEASIRMVQLLDGKDVVAPYADERCLTCHSTTFAPPKDERGAVYSDGVGCEACHGPAERWLGPHVAGQLSAATRAQLGMWNTDQLSSRAKICADCHVGGPGREVNHDLIAAGHPRLQFEMGAYFEALPKHWDEQRDRAWHAGKFDVLTWAVGQATTSQAALEQLTRRAAGKQAWPELSEWSCSACHHDLRDEELRQESLAKAGNLSGRSIGWDDWNHHLPRHYLRAIERAFRLDTTAARSIETEIGELELLVQATRSDRGVVAERARSLAAKLGEWADTLEQATVDRRALDLLSFYIARHHVNSKYTSWSSAAQAYDALASMHQTRLELARAAGQHDDSTRNPLTMALAELYGKLAARHGAPSTYKYDSQQIRDRLVSIQKILQPWISSQ